MVSVFLIKAVDDMDGVDSQRANVANVKKINNHVNITNTHRPFLLLADLFIDGVESPLFNGLCLCNYCC